MGCGASKQDIANYEALQARRDELEIEKAKLEDRIISLEKDKTNSEQKSKEQLNLYRFKIEVMANMLSVEEKKLEATVKRLETLKLAMLTQGFTDKAMNTLLRTGGNISPNGNNKQDNDKSILMTSAYDLSGAISRLKEEMEDHVEDVIHAFANKEGKVISHLTRDEFSRYLYNATSNITKTDVQVLSLRFYDGSTVCVPEFIDFFTSSSSVRVAKAAASAVRVSLNMLQLEDDGDTDETDTNTNTEVEESKLKRSSSNMKNLQSAVVKLLALWEEVEEALIEEFMNIELEIGGNQIVQFDTFQEVLESYCGERGKKMIPKTNVKADSKKKWLTDEDINFIACRFEIGDRIDVKQFFNFFQDAYYSKHSRSPAVAPFQFSQEWSSLKSSTQRDLADFRRSDERNSKAKQEASAKNIDNQNEFVEEKLVEKKLDNKSKAPTSNVKTEEPSQENGMLKTSGPPAVITTSVPTISKSKSEKKIKFDESSKTSTEKPALVTSSSSPNLIVDDQKSKDDEKNKKVVINPPAEIVIPTPVRYKNRLVAFYAEDPEAFENILEKMSSKDGFLMTRDEFFVNLKKMTSAFGNDIDDDINETLFKLKYIGGTGSVADLVAILSSAASRDQEMAATSSSTSPFSTPTAQQHNVKAASNSNNSVFVNLREKYILEKLIDLRATKLDSITETYKTDPKLFVTNLKASTINPKTGDVDGKGNSIAATTFAAAIKKHVVKATDEEVTELEKELNRNIRKNKNDILLSDIELRLKNRLNTMKQISAQITKEEKLLKVEELRTKKINDTNFKINELTEKAQVDSVTAQYALDPKTFMNKLKNGRQGKTISQDELAKYVKENVSNVQTEELEKIRKDLLDVSDVQYPSIDKLLKDRNSTRNKLLQQINKENIVLKKEVNEANNIGGGTGGGCCGGGGKNVHDPNAPQDLPSPQTNATVSLPQTDDNLHIGGGQETTAQTTDNSNVSDLDDNQDSDSNSSPKGKDSKLDDSDIHSNRSLIIPKLKKTVTSETLTYSDYGDDKSDNGDYGIQLDRKEEKNVVFKPKGIAHQLKRGKPSSRPPSSDGSDDDSLIFQAMKKK